MHDLSPRPGAARRPDHGRDQTAHCWHSGSPARAAGRRPGRGAGRTARADPAIEDRPDRGGAEVAIPRGYKLRPVEAVQTWLAAAEIGAGPVFRAVALGGKVSSRPLADESAARVVKRYARRVGLEASTFSGHSLRSGFLTSAAESGA